MIIDIGANHGDFAIEIAKRNPNIKVVAVEPIPVLCDKIEESIIEHKIENVQIVQCAIDIVERKDYLNVAEHHDWGVSSLLEFDQSKIKEDDYWKTRSDMYFDKKIEVEVKRLESIIENLSIVEQINFIKIDTQGLDFNVLKSIGKYVNLIQAGMIEVSISTRLGLYENENYSLIDVLNWLEENGLESYALKPNDPASNEFNLYFCKKGMNFHEIELNLNLRNMHLYDGKFYWHLPSFKLEAFEEKFIFLESTIEKKDKTISEQNALIDRLQKKFLFRLERKIRKILGVKHD